MSTPDVAETQLRHAVDRVISLALARERKGKRRASPSPAESLPTPDPTPKKKRRTAIQRYDRTPCVADDKEVREPVTCGQGQE